MSEARLGLGVRKCGMVEHHGILGELWERKDGEDPEDARKLRINGGGHQFMRIMLWSVGSEGLW
jgi:hypothetical protein